MFNLYNHILFLAFRFLHLRQNRVFYISRKTVSGIFSHRSIVPYHNWNFFGHHTTCFPPIFVNGVILSDVKHFIKCALRAAESYVELDGSSPNARLVANAIENSLQSTPFFAAVLTWRGLLIHFPDKMNILQISESHLAVFFAKIGHQKHNAIG